METASLPTCVGFIMDGNRRYARERGEETVFGHVAGKDKLFEVVGWLRELQIPHAAVYAFSTENWQRSSQEVEALITLFMVALHELLQKTAAENVQIQFIGRRTDFSAELQAEMEKVEQKSAQSAPQLTLWVALSYGGRAEMVAAVNEAIAQSVSVTEESFERLLWSAGMPDIDVLIRTGGEHRLSNFLPWQTAYGELFFSDTYWPAFTKEEFTRILSDYAIRERRKGK